MIFVDFRMGKTAMRRLEKEGELVLFKTENITYSAISAHPDIFMFKKDNILIFAPNLPDKYKEVLEKSQCSLIVGKNPVGKIYPESSYYNASCNSNLLITNIKNADPSILSLFSEEQIINTPQGYSRCNSLIMNENLVLSSDIALCKKHASYLYIDPKEILLEGFEHGFFGGCCGIYQKKVYINGSLKHLKNNKDLYRILEKHQIEVIELSQEKLQDVGGIFFVRP